MEVVPSKLQGYKEFKIIEVVADCETEEITIGRYSSTKVAEEILSSINEFISQKTEPNTFKMPPFDMADEEWYLKTSKDSKEFIKVLLMIGLSIRMEERAYSEGLTHKEVTGKNNK